MKPRLASIAALLSFLSKFYLILSFHIDLDSVALRKQLPASLNYIGITAGASQYFTILLILSVWPFILLVSPCSHIQVKWNSTCIFPGGVSRWSVLKTDVEEGIHFKKMTIISLQNTVLSVCRSCLALMPVILATYHSILLLLYCFAHLKRFWSPTSWFQLDVSL